MSSPGSVFGLVGATVFERDDHLEIHVDEGWLVSSDFHGLTARTKAFVEFGVADVWVGRFLHIVTKPKVSVN